MSKQVLIIDSPLSADGFKSVCNLAPDSRQGAVNLGNYIHSLPAGVQMANVKAQVGAVSATATVTFTGVATNGQDAYIGNRQVSAVTARSTGFEYTIGGSAAVSATNFAFMINTDFGGHITATLTSSTVVTLTAVTPGALGNYLGISNGDIANATFASAFTGGSNGTEYTLDLD